ncbi:protein sorting system archaetidylserine decarboxylase [Natronocalculus amylovorans]|uniref:Protein sorting system archaetidylserine decarboxylase n=1 Tax=Natronocalculus amylovorans TaxID=2917812 RepID=A0AAE3FVN1_9EURY|nr:protein sorting system archaetidylserine decarboxylase [Natronocalculus amylovorans]MCL9815808.1 protein sorting system archaetidylserine decarboxylase [Natronocalculus amylovorans]NUE01680.1 protein sorting system archaetidylserine decarboxylase [Halorubraceae archaeon YAN]
MSVASSLQTAVAPGAWRYALACFLLSAPLAVLFFPLGFTVLLLGVGALWFHRDPDRTPPETGIVAPADGKISVIREETDDKGRSRIRVGVFMNVTDVHVNRAPTDGVVTSVTHRPGAYKPAFSKDSDRNERVVIDCGEYEVALIAGWFARRIHPYVTAGETLVRGQRIGHVSFGSRADILLPPTYDRDDLCITNGDRVYAGTTVIVAE